MLIDHLSLGLPAEYLGASGYEALTGLGDRILRYCPRTGAVRWELVPWESLRSDDATIACRVESRRLVMHCSPARCEGDGDAVFGPGHTNIVEAAGAMVRRLQAVVPVALPDPLRDPSAYQVLRMDVTSSYMLESQAAARQVLTWLRGTEGGRYRVDQTAGDSVYWSRRSRLRAALAYNKGAQLRNQLKAARYTGRRYTEHELSLADRLVRLELRLKAQWWRERCGVRWHQLSEADIRGLWWDWFGQMIGEGVEMVDERDTLRERLGAVCLTAKGEPSARLATAVYGTWSMIQADGWQATRDNLPQNTWYRHLRLLRAAGLTDLDLSHGRVTPLKARRLDLVPCESWAQARAA